MAGDDAIPVDGRPFATFSRSPWRLSHELQVQGMRVGSVVASSAWRGDVGADLPGEPTLAALFAVAVVLTIWELAAGTG